MGHKDMMAGKKTRTTRNATFKSKDNIQNGRTEEGDRFVKPLYM